MDPDEFDINEYADMCDNAIESYNPWHPIDSLLDESDSDYVNVRRERSVTPPLKFE